MSIANTIDLVKQYLDTRTAAHAVHASNVANVETPNWRALVPSFRAVLDKTMQSNAGGVGGVLTPRGPVWKYDFRVQQSQAQSRQDGNNVQLHQEMSAIMENGLRYGAAVKILSKEMAIASYAITSGR